MQEAVATLAQIGTEQAKRTLFTVLVDESVGDSVRRSAVSALSRMPLSAKELSMVEMHSERIPRDGSWSTRAPAYVTYLNENENNGDDSNNSDDNSSNDGDNNNGDGDQQGGEGGEQGGDDSIGEANVSKCVSVPSSLVDAQMLNPAAGSSRRSSLAR